MVVTLSAVKVLLPNGTCEYLVTSLDSSVFSPEKLKKLYHLRWSIKTSFLHLKHTIGGEYFRSCKRDLAIQEIWVWMILYNFCMKVIRDVPPVE